MYHLNMLCDTINYKFNDMYHLNMLCDTAVYSMSHSERQCMDQRQGQRHMGYTFLVDMGYDHMNQLHFI